MSEDNRDVVNDKLDGLGLILMSLFLDKATVCPIKTGMAFDVYLFRCSVHS